ncbi:transcription factor TFIIIB component B'' homolog isoform X2 [Trachinotus anak]|uniref:transcription factor TFIIIB component B'' homolog isoform X2 n=1 Tax=Trachinotus anak TaxID=443729 RepID=UPI0039F1DA51
MFRRSRFSIRPNVSTAGRTAATPQEAPSATQEASETPRDVSDSTPTAVTDTKSVVTPSEKPTASGDGTDQNGEGTSSSAAVQRRKRFTVKPKVAPGRPSTLARTAKSPVKAVSETPVEVPGSDLDKSSKVTQTGTKAAPAGLQSPKRRRPSEESKQATPPTPVSSDSPGPSADPQVEKPPEQTNLPTDSGKPSGSQVKDVPPRPPDKIPPSLPDKEAVEISEKAKTLVSSKSGLSLSPPALSLSRLLNDPSDLQRLAKAQKLRELLRQERHKEKKVKKAKLRPKEYTLDPAKMTMRDLIRYLPESNPMTSTLEESAEENETVVPPSPVREESPERAQEPEEPKVPSSREEEEEVAEEEQEDSLMVPQVKVAEDGSLIIDEESLTVEVQRAKGPNPAQDREPIFERGSTTTYSSFRKGTHSKPWSSEETDMFLLAISMVGTDFSMICQLFPHRARSEIKNKFKKEERENSWRIDKAFRERRKLDIEYFSKLLEKILEVQKNRKKLRKLAEKNTPKKHKKKAKGKKAAKKLSDVEEEDEEDESEVPDLEDEEEGEKENEDLCNDGGDPVSKPKRQRKRKTRQAAVNEEPNEKKNKTGEQSNEQGEACIPEDPKAALPEDHTSPDMSEKSENVNASKDTAIKPAKLSRGRAPKPLLPLGRKWGKKPPPASTKGKETADQMQSDKGDESVSDGASNEQENKDSSPSRKANKRKSANADISSEEEDAIVQPQRPTRYGRVPKPINPLNYPAKDDAHTSASDPTSASPEGSTASAAKAKPKCSAKRGRSSKEESAQESKKPKLVTLRASRSEYSDEENEKEKDHEEIEEEEQPACSPSKDSSAPVFVPASLRSLQPVISEVEETMEELDILANMPDVLGISQDALCPDASCERVQNEAGTAEPCEHQLDLLVDVIDFLSSEHTEVSEDESYNEAAQTLLTIGNLTHLPQSVQNQIDTQDPITGTTSVNVIETTQHPEEETAPKPSEQEENTATPIMSGHRVPETSETITTVESQNSTPDNGDLPIIKTNDQMCGEQTTVSDMDPSPQLQSGPESSKQNSPQTRRGRVSRVKPKPNLGRASRTAQAKSPPDTSTVQTAGEGNTEAANLQVPQSLSAPEQTSPQIPEYSPTSLMDATVSQVESGAATSDQSIPENQSHCCSDAQFVSTGEQASRDKSSTSESSDEKVLSHAEIILSCPNNSTTSNTSVTESQVEQESNTDSVPVQEGSQHSAAFVTAVDLPISQRAQSEVAATCQSRRSRLQKVKPKTNLPQTSRTARSRPQTTKDSVEKNSSPTPISKVHEKTITDVEPETTCGTSSEKPSESTGPASVLIPSLDLGSTLTPTKELSTTEEKMTDLGLVGKVYSVAATSDQSPSENQSLSEEPFKSSSRDTGSTSESTEEKGTSHDGTTESSNNLVTSDSAVTESQVGQDTTPVQESSDQPATCVTPVEDLTISHKAESEVTSTCQSGRGRLQKMKPKPNLVQTSRTARSKPQTTKASSPTSMPESSDNRIAEVEAQPICSITLPAKSSQGTGTASVSVPSLELCTTHKSTEELPSTVEQKTDVELNSSSQSSEPTVSQRRRYFPKVRPNLGSSTRTTQTKSQPKNISKPSAQEFMDTSSHVTSEQPVDDSQTELNLAEKDHSHLTAKHCQLNTELSSTRSVPAESEETLHSGNDEDTSSDGIVIATSWFAENQFMLTDSVPENKNGENSTFGRDSEVNKMSNNDRLEAGPSSQGDCKLDMSTRITETNIQPSDDPAEVSGVQSSEEGSTESKIDSVLADDACSIPDPKEGSLQPCSESDSELKSQKAVQQCSETQKTNQTSKDKSQSARSTNDTDLTDSSKPSKKAPQTHRGRLIKPKPNLGRSSRPQQPQQVQNTTQAEADSGAHSEDVNASVSHQPMTELRPDIQEPVEGAVEPYSGQEGPSNDAESLLGSLTEIIEQLSQHDPPTNDAGPSLGCVTQVQDNSFQNTSTSTEGTQIHPSLTIFPDMLSEQVPPDPDEPFFILSLTEIPVCSSGQVADSAAEPLPYLPVADASIQQHSVPGESFASAGDGSLSKVPAPISVEESGEMGHMSVKDTGLDSAAYIDSITDNPVDPHESTTVHPPELPETVEKNDETEIPPSKERLTGTGRRAKLKVKPNTTKKKQASKSLATNISQDSELAGASVQSEASDATAKGDDEVVNEPQKSGGDQVNIEKESPTGRKGPEDQSSGAQTQTTRRTGVRNRKPKDSLSLHSDMNSTAPSSDPSPGKAATKGPRGKTPRTRKHLTPTAPVPSTSHSVAPKPNLTHLPEETHSISHTTSPALTDSDIELTTEHNRPCSDQTLSTSQSTAEVSAPQQSDCVESSSTEEEPTSVSQYFLSDIFTEVEEG